MKKKNPEKNAKDNNIILNWASIKHNRLFDHIIALGSRVDMIVTANSILIAGLLIIIFGSSSSNHIRSKMGCWIPALCFTLLGTSLVLCIISIFLRVNPAKCKGPFFKEKPANLNKFIEEINRYADRAEPSINKRHMLIDIAACSLLGGLVCLAIIVILCLKP